ncbi:MAG TPA: prolipoprotein diacylglyceryl transferase [Cyclobacteriaceae bacterium]|nr:prolipoprotein diacylglyceryl transferase [Cyclobacteriaceae bacterium]
MNLFSYIIWNASPDIFTLPIPFIDKELTLRWYGLLFALGFLISQQILYYIFKKEGKPEKDVDTLTIYMVVATVIGARLGHVLFYEPERYLSNPIDILKIWEGGLASHGATVGILFALWLYGRKKLPGQNYLQTLDRIVILVALTGALIRFGNFMNSEIIGKPTHSDSGVVFTRTVTEVLKSDDAVKDVKYIQVDTASNEEGYRPVKILIEFSEGDNSYDDYAQYVEGRVNSFLSFNSYVREHINQTGYVKYKISQDESQKYYAIINTFAIPRHPAQLYESISCIFLFAFLLWIWTKHKEKLAEGRLFAIFLIVCFGLRFLYEFLKENQVEFENSLALNMGQLLSIPLVLLGFYMLYRSYQKKEA